MNKWIPISVWLLVAVLGIWVLLKNWPQPENTSSLAGDSAEMTDGRVFVDVPWRQLPSVGDFHLTNQNDQEFSSAAETGHPYLVNFFFSTCPTICRQFNTKMKAILDQYDGTDLELVSITVDAEVDTPELLAKYAKSFQADQRWQFLTGQPYQVKQTGNFVFHVPLEKATHTEKIILVDRWGKIRDWFDWNDPEEIQRLKTTVDEVLQEKKPPFGKQVHTRYAYAGTLADLWKQQDWISEFKLTDRNGETFYSRDMTGKVWLASFFFSTCPGICQVQNRHLSGYLPKIEEKDLTLVSITTDPVTDKPAVLKDYARQFTASNDPWRFLTTEEPLLIKRLGEEYFGASAGSGHHSSRVYVVDKWGNVRGDFDWQVPEQEQQMWQMVDELNAETEPAKVWEHVRAGQPELPAHLQPLGDEEEEDLEAETASK